MLAVNSALNSFWGIFHSISIVPPSNLQPVIFPCCILSLRAGRSFINFFDEYKIISWTAFTYPILASSWIGAAESISKDKSIRRQSLCSVKKLVCIQLLTRLFKQSIASLPRLNLAYIDAICACDQPVCALISLKSTAFSNTDTISSFVVISSPGKTGYICDKCLW